MCVKTHRGRRRPGDALCAATAVMGCTPGRGDGDAGTSYRLCCNQPVKALEPARRWLCGDAEPRRQVRGDPATFFCWNHDLILLEPARIFATSIFRFCLKPVICFLLWEEFFVGTGVSFAGIGASGEFCWNQDVCFAGNIDVFCCHRR